MTKYIKYIIIYSIIGLFHLNLFHSQGIGRDWSDLDEGEKKVYGSEKEEKYAIKAFFIEKEDWENHYALNVLWVFKKTDYPRYTSFRILPFYYNLRSKIDNRTRTIWPLFFHYTRTDGTDRLIVNPFYYSNTGLKKKSKSLLYLYWWGKSDNYYKKRSYFLFPVFYYEKYHSTDNRIKRTFLVNPLYHYDYYESNTAQESGRGDYTFWAPIIPLTYHYSGEKGGHRNFFWLIDYSWKKAGAKERLKRFWIAPLFFWKRGDYGYNHIIPPLYMNFKDGADDYYRHVLPLFINSKSVKETGYLDDETHELTRKKIYSNKLYTLLFCYSGRKKEQENGKEKSISSTLWFPVIPVYYSHKDIEEGTHRNIFWFLDWHTDKSGSLTRMWIIPIVFHKAKKSGYRSYAPFFFRLSSSTDESGVSFSMIHYHKWSPEKNILWILPYYSMKDSGKKKELKIAAPFYFYWKSEKRDWRLIIPWSFNYKDERGSFYFNISGISKSILSGPYSPNVDLDIGMHKGSWFLDTDISWLYDAVSLATRITFKKALKENDFPDEEMTGNSEIENIDENKTEEKSSIIVDNKKNIPALQKKRAFTRENTESFWGWKLLYGWLAYEKGDSKRHFRLLPLSWLTWDEKSNDKLYVIPPLFLFYKSELDKLQYFVLFPFYGSQKEKNSYINAYLINMYWDEYNAEEKLREHSVLWPIINWYKSPKKSGWRFIPFVWHKESTEKNIHTSRYISLIHYSKYITDKKKNDTIYRFMINPFIYAKKVSKPNKITEKKFFPLIPIYYSSLNRIKYVIKRDIILPENDEKEVNNDINNEIVNFRIKKHSFVFPIFYDKERVLISNGIKKESEYSLYSLPLLYYNSRKIFESIQPAESFQKEYSFFLLGFYYHRSPEYSKTSFFYSLYQYISFPNNASELKLLYGLFKSYGSDNETKFRIFPFISYNSSPGMSHLNILGFMDTKSAERYNRFFILPFYYSSRSYNDTHKNIIGIIDWEKNKDKGLQRLLVLPIFMWYPGRESHFILLPMLIYFGKEYDESTKFILGTYWKYSKSYERQNILYLFDHRRYINTNRNEYKFLLGMGKYTFSPEYREIELMYGLLMDYNSYKSYGGYNFDLLLFLITAEKHRGYFKNSFLPLWYYKSGRDRWSLLNPALLTYFSKDQTGDFDLCLLGLLYLRNNRINKKKDLKMVLGGTLWYEVKRPERGYHSRGMMWGLLWDYEKENETGFMKFTILKGLYKQIKINNKVKRKFLWIF